MEPRKFITAFTRARHYVPILSQLDPIRVPLNIRLNIILPSTPGSSKATNCIPSLYEGSLEVSKENGHAYFSPLLPG